MDVMNMHRLVELRKRRDELESLLNEVRKEENALSLALVEDFTESQVQSVNLKALGATLYKHRTLSATLIKDDLEAAHEALRGAGLGWMVKPNVNPQTLSAWVRDLEKNKQEMPPGLAAVLDVYEEYRVKVLLNGSGDEQSAVA